MLKNVSWFYYNKSGFKYLRLEYLEFAIWHYEQNQIQKHVDSLKLSGATLYYGNNRILFSKIVFLLYSIDVV